jgi:glycosyltransferase involved in cell wall biosynthesis
MRIVLLSTGHPVYDTFPEGGGIQYQILGLATHIAKSGHDVHIICRAVNPLSLIVNGVTFHTIPLKIQDQILSVLMFSKQACRIIRSLEPDVVAASERFSAYYPSKEKNPPLTFTTHNYDAFRYYKEFAIEHNSLNAFVFPWKSRLEEGVMKRSRLVISLTNSIRHYLAAVGIHNTRVIPNGVFSGDYENAGEHDFILYAGRLDAPKRVDLLIRAFAALGQLREDYVLKVVGRGPQHSALLRLSRDLGIASRVQFTGWLPRKELVYLLNRCTTFVLPSMYETFGVVLLEAMAAGKPVIASDLPGIGELIENHANGMLVRPGDASSLSRAMEICLEDDALRKTLGERARNKIETTYDFSVVTKQNLEAFDQIVR